MSNTPHDHFFKRMLRDPPHAAGVLRAILPEALAARIDWSTLESLPGDYVDDEDKERPTDLLFKAQVDGSPTILVLLLEHQSAPDPGMPLRLFHYMSHIWTHLKEEAEKAGRKLTKIPLIIPMVLHHGAQGWSAPTHLSEQYDAAPELLDAARAHVPDFELLLFDLVHVSEEQIDALPLTDRAALTLVGFTATFREPDPDKLPLRTEQLQRVLAADGEDAVRSYTRYISRFAPGEKLVDAILHTDATKEVIVGLRQEWEAAAEARGEARGKEIGKEIGEQIGKEIGRERGLAEGELKGQAKVLANLIRFKFKLVEVPEEVPERLAKASAEELERLTQRIVEADSLDELW